MAQEHSTWKVADLVGCEVFSASNERLGVLKDVLPTGNNDVWVIASDNDRELLLPALKSVVMSVDTAARRIDVVLPPGLKEVYNEG
jgi:16S rRNA processing protein RimM